MSRWVDLDEQIYIGNDGECERYNIDIDTIKAMPCGWIPVSERLPEIGQKVLASTKSTVFTQVYKGIYSEPNAWHWNHNSIKVVTAWQPLPEPYREDGEA